ncbi:MAG: leucine-rich repeat protein [Acutalibacteraceae bacterium]
MKTGKKAVCVLMVVLMCLTSAPLQGLVGIDLPSLFTTKASAADLAATGKCGDNVTYTYNSKTGEVVISGTGEMYDYQGFDSPFNNDVVSVVIKNGVTSIGEYAFFECNNLASVLIGNSVISIGSGAFSRCYKLEDLAIPSSVTSIHINAFRYCKLTNITVDVNNKYYSSDEYGVLFNKNKSKLVQYPQGNSRASYKIPESVKIIGKYAFFYCGRSLKTITIPNSVTNIEDHAFQSCMGLTSVTIPDSVTSIGYGAFTMCNSLTSVTIGNSVKTIGDSAFCDCYSLKDVYYTGTSSQWENIEIEKYNECLTNATIHYNYSPSSLVLGKTSKITATQTTSAVTLKWNAVPNATGYKIYQKTSKGWQSLGNVTGTSKTVSGLTAGTKYTFAVKAFAVKNGKTIWSDVYTTINTATKAVKPAKVTSTQNENSIKLTWTKSTGATGYRIYYRTSTKADWKVGKSSTTATSHTFSNLKPNQAFQFAVRPYITTDSGVVWSDYTTITASTTPAVPVAKVSSPSKGKVTLTWNAVSGATGYQVYYKVGNGSWKLYKTTSKPATYNFTKLKSGTKYTFAVRAYRTVSGTNFTSGYKAVSVTVK